jgi:MinD superfamily P-loop ATPase
VLGELINEIKIDDFQFPPEVTEIKGFLKTFLGFLKVHLTTHPSINSEQCEKCNNCVEACPMKCIALLEGRLVVNSKGCIQCLCCMEVCPNGAIDLREGFLLKLLKHFKVFEETP